MSKTPTYDRLRSDGYEHAAAIDALIGMLRLNFPMWPSTFSLCDNEGCDRMARGGGFCADHLADEIAEATGMPGHARCLLEYTESAAEHAAALLATKPPNDLLGDNTQEE